MIDGKTVNLHPFHQLMKSYCHLQACKEHHCHWKPRCHCSDTSFPSSILANKLHHSPWWYTKGHMTVSILPVSKLLLLHGLVPSYWTWKKEVQLIGGTVCRSHSMYFPRCRNHTSVMGNILPSLATALLLQSNLQTPTSLSRTGLQH